MNDRQQSTHHHANEQLLIGWMVGASGSYNNAKLKHQQGQTMTLNAMAPSTVRGQLYGLLYVPPDS
jgi:hypothetical protein